MAEETSKELRDLQTVTNIRKITQEALAPVIKKYPCSDSESKGTCKS